jgi:hypothetical protein
MYLLSGLAQSQTCNAATCWEFEGVFLTPECRDSFEVVIS